MTYINIIAGFLNAGKTTFINQLCHTVYQDESFYVLQNEDGKAKLHFEEQTNALRSSSMLRQGCLCCSKTDEFERLLDGLLADGRYEQIFIETAATTRLADLIPLIRTHMSNTTQAMLGFIIFIADTKDYRRRRLMSEQFYNSQLRSSTHLYLTKEEQIFESDIAAIKEELTDIAPNAVLITETSLQDLKNYKTAMSPIPQISYRVKNQPQKAPANALGTDFHYTETESPR